VTKSFIVIERESGCDCCIVDLPNGQGFQFIHAVQFAATLCPHGSRVRPFDAADAVGMLGIAIEDDVDLDQVADHESFLSAFSGLKQEAKNNAERLREAANLMDQIAEDEAGWESSVGLKQESEHNASRLRDAASYVRDALRVRSGDDEELAQRAPTNQEIAAKAAGG
jgi:hypothetical protein